MKEDIDQEVRAALDRRRGEWRELAVRSGVSYSWIGKFMNHRIPNPGVETLRMLRSHLVQAETRNAA